MFLYGTVMVCRIHGRNWSSFISVLTPSRQDSKMAALTSQTCKKWSTTIGVFLNIFPLGLLLCWGNLYVYVISYVIARGESTTGVTGPWLVAGFSIGCSIGSFLSGFMIDSYGKRPTAVCGAFLCTFSFIFTYFILGMNTIVTQMILGTTFATGYFILNGVIMVYCADWSSSDFGSMNAIAQAGSPAGAAVLNQIITVYVNPDNLTPDSTFGPLRYFSQDEVLDRVHPLLLILASITAFFCIASMFLVRNNPEKYLELDDLAINAQDSDKDRIASDKGTSEQCSEKSQESKTIHDSVLSQGYGAVDSEANWNNSVQLPYPKPEIKEIKIKNLSTGQVEMRNNLVAECPRNKLNEFENGMGYCTRKQLPVPTPNLNQGHKIISDETTQTTGSDVIDPRRHTGQASDNTSNGHVHDRETQKPVCKQSQNDKLSWRQIVYNPLFGHYCVLGFISNTTYSVFSAYNKQYGQIYISDDHFMTHATVVMLVVMFLSRTGWGKFQDHFGTKNTFIAHFSSAGVSALLFYFAPMIGRYCYLVVTIIFASTAGNVYVLVIYACYETFGTSNLVLSFGLVFMPLTFLAVIVSHLLEMALTSGGWFSVFLACSSWNLFGLLYCIFRLK